jgi:hypothetical protein
VSQMHADLIGCCAYRPLMHAWQIGKAVPTTDDPRVTALEQEVAKLKEQLALWDEQFTARVLAAIRGLLGVK